LNDTFCTYSLIAPGSSTDESRYIKEVGRNTDTKQFFTTLNEDEFLEEFHDFIVAQEEPVTGLSPYAQYRVMKLAHQQGAKVLLDGQGGDELFAGYIYYFSWYFYELLTKFRWFTLIKEIALYLRNFKNIFPHAMFIFLLLPDSTKYVVWKKLMNKWVNHELVERLCQEKDPRWKSMSLEDGLLLTLFSTAIPHLLRWEDKSSMRWSIESRVPFLDVAVVECASSLPSEQKLHNGRTKVTFRRAMEDILPEMIKNRTDKIGFGTPVDDFFRNEKIMAFSREIVYSESFKKRPYWNWEEVPFHRSKSCTMGEQR